MNRFFILICLIFPFYALFGGLTGETKAMELMNPAEHTVYHEEIASVVVAFTSDTIERIIISSESNQSSVLLPQGGRQTYCKSVRLIPGENTITVRGIRKDGGEEKISAVIYHDIVSEKIYKYPPPIYEEKSFHIANNEKKCAPCHKMEVNEIKGVAFEDPSTSNCFPCHQKLTTRGQGHAPAINWLCTSCHERHDASSGAEEGNRAQFTLPSKIGKTCLMCHKKEKEKWEEKRLHHMPVDAEKCTRCHNPHSSENKFYLKAKSWNICTSCHIDKREGNHVINTFGNKEHPTRGKPDPSRPGQEIECISCHNPHASNTRSLIDADSPMSICVKCHKK